MPKKSYALRNRRGYMDSTFDEGLRIVLQWMELRRRNFERLLQVWQKELYMLRRMYYPRHDFYPGLLPGLVVQQGPSTDPTVREELDWFRNRMGMRARFGNHGLPYHAPGY